MWTVNITYDDANNFLNDKSLLSAAIESVIAYLNSFIAGTTTINLKVEVSQTATGRFAGGGAWAYDHTADGLNYIAPQVMKELAAGTNLNGATPDLVIYVDPTSSYFKSLSFDAGAYTAPHTVPANQTDGQTVLLHEIMHGLGLTANRNYVTGQFLSDSRTTWDSFIQQTGSRQLLNVPAFATQGLAPVQVSTDTEQENYSHLGNHAGLDQGYVDDLMNGLYFITGHRYYMSQIDLMILAGVGYKVTIPDTMALSYYDLLGHGQVKPTLSASSLANAASSNVLHLSGTAAAGAMTSVLEHRTLLATTTADATGHWSMEVITDPSLSTSSLVVRDGSHAVDSAAVMVTRNTDVGNHLFGSAQYSKLVGTSHADLFTAGPRGAAMDGGGGLDTVEYSAARAANTIQKQGDGYVVKDATGADTLTGIERIRFSDGMVALDVGSDGIAGQAYRLYQAAFNRIPDSAGLGYWIGVMDRGASLLDVANEFVGSTEFKALYGAQPGNADILGRYYHNVLHRDADTAGFQYWLDVLDRHVTSAAEVLASFSQSQENQAALVGVIGNGISYTPFG
jgi:hypothetical protein